MRHGSEAEQTGNVRLLCFPANTEKSDPCCPIV